MSSAPPTAPPGRGRLPVQGRRDRRAALSALALLLVVLGALGAALVVYRTGHRTDVLVAARDIQAGEKITADDFATARVAADSGETIAASDESNFIGTYARTDIPTGTLLNHLMFLSGSIVPADGVVIGVTVQRNQRPATDIVIGDKVRVYEVPKATAGRRQPVTVVLVDAARVTSVSGSSSTSDSLTVSLLVTQDTAKTVVAAANQGSVALAELPKTAVLPIDFASQSS